MGVECVMETGHLASDVMANLRAVRSVLALLVQKCNYWRRSWCTSTNTDAGAVFQASSSTLAVCAVATGARCTRFTCFTVLGVLGLLALLAVATGARCTRFTCFTSTRSTNTDTSGGNSTSCAGCDGKPNRYRYICVLILPYTAIYVSAYCYAYI
jgi:hypothetical protein